MRNSRVWLILLVCTLGTLNQSCVRHKDLITLNANEMVPENLRTDKTMEIIDRFKYKPHKIKPYDLLMIKINAFDGSTEEFLNREFANQNVYSNDIDYNPASLYFNSYTVDEEGYLYLPVIEKIKVTGLTVSELKQKLDEAFKPHLRFASTNVKLANLRVAVLGEVNKPGLHYLYNEQNTLLDAISVAGDFTDFGNRRKVKLIRQTEDGSKTVYLNLFRSDFLTTEYFYMQPNDMIYVEPVKTKAWDTSAKSLGVVFSGLSLGALIISIFK